MGKKMSDLSADYLVVGCGAVSMAFVDTMLDETDATFIIVDRHHMPGGHWNDAYPFVRLHQPSAFYGVASTDMGSNQIDTVGSNKGFYELASGQEVAAYFENLMRTRFLPSGRVQYFPMCDYAGEHVFRSLLSDAKYKVEVKRRVVDGTFFNTSVPSMHERKYAVDDGVTCVAPNELPRLAADYDHYVILGGGKTAMDAAVWLLDSGAMPDSISWVCPRASWLINRAITQPGKDFFPKAGSAIANQFDAMIAAQSVDDLFLRLEEAGNMIRLDPDIMPTMFHYATLSEGEAEQLRRIQTVIRDERVERLTPGKMLMQSDKEVDVPENALFVDCTATAVIFSDETTKPVFEPGLITLQAVFAPLVTYSSAIIAHAEASFDDDDKKNMLCKPVELADTPAEWIRSTVGNLMNQNAWSQAPEMKAWVNKCRLSPVASALKEGAMEDPDNQKLMGSIGQKAIPAIMNVQKLYDEVTEST